MYNEYRLNKISNLFILEYFENEKMIARVEYSNLMDNDIQTKENFINNLIDILNVPLEVFPL